MLKLEQGVIAVPSTSVNVTLVLDTFQLSGKQINIESINLQIAGLCFKTFS